MRPGVLGVRRSEGFGQKAMIFTSGTVCGIVLTLIIGYVRTGNLGSGGLTEPKPRPTPAPKAAITLPPSPQAAKAPPKTVRLPVVERQASAVAPPPPREAVLEVDNRTPQKGRGIRITLRLPPGVTPSDTPYLELKDSKGGSYRSEMKVGTEIGEWFWASGLDVPGRWRGAAYARMDGRTLSAPLPRITVQP